MTRESAKRHLEFIKAFADGKSLQWRAVGIGTWLDCDHFGEMFMDQYEFRIKPEPKLRPWKDRSEFPSGDVWLRTKLRPSPDCRVVCISERAVSYVSTDVKHVPWGHSDWLALDYSTDNCRTFQPCGVLEGAQ